MGIGLHVREGVKEHNINGGLKSYMLKLLGKLVVQCYLLLMIKIFLK